MMDDPYKVLGVSPDASDEEIKQAYGRGQRVFGETCSHYLVLDTEDLAKPNFEGAKYVCSPALRTEEHREALWEAVDRSWLNAISSDHCGFDFAEQKHMGFGEGNSFADIPTEPRHFKTDLTSCGLTGYARARSQEADWLTCSLQALPRSTVSIKRDSWQ